MSQPQPKTAVLYARVSDRKQAQADVSIPAQLEAGRRKADELNAVVVQVFQDGGRSAFKEKNRPSFQNAVDYCIETGADYLITWSSSRFARSKFEAMVAKRALASANVRLIYTSADIDLDTDEGWLIDSMFEILDESRSRSNSKDTLRSMIRQTRQGYFCGGSIPFGFRGVPDPEFPKRRRLVPHEENAEWVLQMFQLRAQGIGATQISEWLNAKGALRHDKSRWSKTSVLYVLRNELVTGRRVFGRKSRDGKLRDPSQWVVVDGHTPIVPVELWKQVQGLMDTASPCLPGYVASPKSMHPFTGLLRCGICSQAMQIETARGRRRVYAYYICQRSLKHKDCVPRRIRADLLDPWLSEVIAHEVINAESMQAVAAGMEQELVTYASQNDKMRQALERRMEALRRGNDRLLDVLQELGRDAPNLAEVGPRMRENNEAIRQIEADLANLQTSNASTLDFDSDSIAKLAEFMRGELIDQQNARASRNFFTRFIRSITVHGDAVEISYDPSRLLSRPSAVHSDDKWRPRPDSNRRPSA